MTTDIAIELCRSALWTALTLCGPVMLVALLIGLIIGLGQALTQLQDPSFIFVSKLVTLAFVIVLLLPWGLDLLADYAAQVIRGIPDTI